ncbi:uncharacterized protein TNCV_4582701 [Trichonephila clavipes]|nr:uncharacterized protein TNCV_4582701 [Trichonephila clavipes]
MNGPNSFRHVFHHAFNQESRATREDGFSSHNIAESLSRNISTAHDYWEQRSRDGTTSRGPGSGLPRDTTERENRRIQLIAVVHRTVSAAKIRTVGDTANC